MDIDFPFNHSIQALNIKIELNASIVLNASTKLFLLKFPWGVQKRGQVPFGEIGSGILRLEA